MATGKRIERPVAGVAASASVPARHPDDRRFLDLNSRFPLRPIRSRDSLGTAHEIIREMASRDELDPAEDDYLDVLGDLVWKYERETDPIPDVSAEDMLRHILESRGVTQAELSRGTGIGEPTISAILSGKRMMNRRHIAAVCSYFDVSPALFFPA